jgi:hypothetical protein
VYFRRVSEAMPSPTLTDGQPQDDWAPSSRVDEDWGRVRIVIGGVDVTFLRGIATVVEEYVHAKPYGPLSCRLRFPQISIFDSIRPPSGDLTFLAPGSYIELDWIKPDESFGGVLWDGLIMPVQSKRAEELTGVGLVMSAIGIAHQLNFYRRAPGISNAPYDIGVRFASEWSLASRPAGRWIPPPVVMTGVMRNYRGNWEGALDYLTRLSEDSLGVDGRGWYCVEVPPRQIEVRQTPDMTVADWSVAAGGNGVAVDLNSDPTVGANVFYLEAVDPAGATLRNMYTDSQLGQGVPFFQPWGDPDDGYDERVHLIDPGPHGTLIEPDPSRLDVSVLRQEAFLGKGQGVDYAEGVASAKAAYAQLNPATTGWAGTVTLRQDPEEGSRLRIRADDNIRVRYFNGAGVVANIAEARVTIGESQPGSGQAGSPTVALKVDTKARNLPTLMAVLKRQRDLVQNPVKRLLTGKDSGLVQDKLIQWDATRSGYVPNGGSAYNRDGAVTGTLGFGWADPSASLACPAGRWTICRFLMSQADTIVNTLVTTGGAPTEFCVAVFDRPMFGGGTGTLPINPFVTGADSTLRAATGYLIHWGNPDQHAGYSPGLQSDSDPITGLLEDQAAWSYAHPVDPATQVAVEPAFLWLAVYPLSATHLTARFVRQAT